MFAAVGVGSLVFLSLHCAILHPDTG